MEINTEFSTKRIPRNDAEKAVKRARSARVLLLLDEQRDKIVQHEIDKQLAEYGMFINYTEIHREVLNKLGSTEGLLKDVKKRMYLLGFCEFGQQLLANNKPCSFFYEMPPVDRTDFDDYRDSIHLMITTYYKHSSKELNKKRYQTTLQRRKEKEEKEFNELLLS